MGGAGGEPSSNIPAEFHPLLASKVDLFIIKTREVATNNMGKALYTFSNRNTPTLPICFQKFQNKFLKFDQQIVGAPPGFYTWILKDFDNGLGRHLVFAQTPSKQEVGTLHINLDALTADGTVFIAGELQISEDRKYFYNILSGTYSARIKPVEEQERRNPELQKVLKSYGIPETSIVLRGYTPIIDTATIVMTSEMRTFYTSCGMARKSVTGGARRSRKHKRSRKVRRTRCTLKHGRSPRNYSR